MYIHFPTAMPQMLSLIKCGYRPTQVLLKMVTHLDGVWWSRGDPLFFVVFCFVAPSLKVSKTPEIITFRWWVYNLNFYLN